MWSAIPGPPASPCWCAAPHPVRVVRIEDNGRGMPATRGGNGGLGLRNMAERVERLDGTPRILSSRTGTVIEAQVPMSHMLPPTDRAEGAA